MKTLIVVLATIVIYSVVSTIVIEICNENDNVIAAFGFGVFGLLCIGACKIINKVNRYFKYHYNKRSIFKNKTNGKMYVCHVKDCNDVNWNENYHLVKRYAKKAEWLDLPKLDNNVLEVCRRNCDNCKYDRKCSQGSYAIKCKHDEFGTVTEFDKFVKKRILFFTY